MSAEGCMTDRLHRTVQDGDLRNLICLISACTLGLWAFAAGLLIGAFLMLSAKTYASTILSAFENAHAQLVGKAVVLTDGKPERSSRFGLMRATVFGFLSGVTMENGLSQQSNSRKWNRHS
jgi:hypothetical protein